MQWIAVLTDKSLWIIQIIKKILSQADIYILHSMIDISFHVNPRLNESYQKKKKTVIKTQIVPFYDRKMQHAIRPIIRPNLKQLHMS